MTAAPALPPSSLVYRLPPAAVHELLGWNIWSAAGRLARVDVLRVGDRLEVTLSEGRVDRPDRRRTSDQEVSRTRLVLGPDGQCSATHTASPSVLHVSHAGVAGNEVSAATRDGGRSEVRAEHGDVLVATTAAFLQVAPAALLAQIPSRTRRRRSLAGLANDMVRRVGRGAAGDRAGIVVAQRVWPAGD